MSVSMEKNEALEQELAQSAEAAESTAEAVAEIPAEGTEAAQEAASEPAPETSAQDEDDDHAAFRPHDVSEDGSPHGPLDLFSDEEEEKKDVPAFAAFHAPDGRKPGELDPEDEEEDYAPAPRKEAEDEDDEEEEFEEGEAPMTLMGHLNELRRRLFRIVIIVLLGFVAFYGVAEYLYAYLSAPLQAQLPAGSKLIYTSPAGAFFTYMKVALVASLFGTSPISFYQVWAFIAPGLYKEEKRAVLPLAFFSSIFFVAGAAFCF